MPKWVSGSSSSSRSPLLVVPLPDHGGTNSPTLTSTGCSGGRWSVQEPIVSYCGQGSSEIISGLPKTILQAGKESSGKQRTINLFITVPAALWKTAGEVKNLEFEVTSFDCRAWQQMVKSFFSLKSSFHFNIIANNFPMQDCNVWLFISSILASPVLFISAYKWKNGCVIMVMYNSVARSSLLTSLQIICFYCLKFLLLLDPHWLLC